MRPRLHFGSAAYILRTSREHAGPRAQRSSAVFEYIVVTWAAVAITCAVLAGIVAGIKNRDYSFWITMSFLVPPAVLVVLLLPKRSEPPPRRRRLDEEDEAEI